MSLDERKRNFEIAVDECDGKAGRYRLGVRPELRYGQRARAVTLKTVARTTSLCMRRC